MTREKMMDLWRKELKKYGTHISNLSEVLTDWVESDTSTPFPNVQRTHSPVTFPDWMVQELDGENSELAGRMLFAITCVRDQGIIHRVSEKEVQIAIRIGYGFMDILRELRAENVSRYGLEVWYEMAEKLAVCFPQEAEQIAQEQLFNTSSGLAGRLKQMMPGGTSYSIPDVLKQYKIVQETDKGPADIFLSIGFVISVLRKRKGDHALYSSFVTELIDALKDFPHFQFDILYQAYREVPDFKSKLYQLIDSSEDIYRSLHYHLPFSERKDIIAFLDELGFAHWPYSFIILDRYNRDHKKGKLLSLIHQQDPVNFKELYDRARNLKWRLRPVYSCYLLSIYLKNGEMLSALNEADVALEEVVRGLLPENKEVERLITLLKGNTPVDQIGISLNMKNYFDYVQREYFECFAILSDYSPFARRIISYFLYTFLHSEEGPVIDLLFIYLNARWEWLDMLPQRSAQTLFESAIGITIKHIFQLYCYSYSSYYYQDNKTLMSQAVTREWIHLYEKEAFEALEDPDFSVEQTVVWIDHLYGKFGMQNHLPLVPLMGYTSKPLRRKAEEYIYLREQEVRKELEQQLKDWKKENQLVARKLLKRWDNERKFGKDFSFTENSLVTEFCTDNYEKSYDKGISWIPEELFEQVHFANLTEKAPAIIVRYVLSEYMALEESLRIGVCDKIVAALSQADFSNMLEQIYLFWKGEGSNAKYKNIMLAYCIYGSDSQLLKLRTQLKDWAENSRGAVAAFVVNAIALNAGSVALMMVDNMSVKFAQNQIKKAAKGAFAFAAKALGVSMDELSDKIVPDLGFSRDGTKNADYGSRSFIITLSPDFSLSVYDPEKEKKVKSLPAPGINDDKVKAETAKTQFNELKKQLKATVQLQTSRLEKAFMNGRSWHVADWQQLFVNNPIMRPFATGLIWSVYEQGQLVATFRYQDDGTFNTVEEEEYILAPHVRIALAHPAELSPELTTAWQQQLEDYEIVPPFSQLSAPVVTLPAEEVKEKAVKRYCDQSITVGHIHGLAKKYNFQRASVEDGGSFVCYHWLDTYQGIGVLINVDYMYMGQDFDEVVTLGDVLFYSLDEEGNTQDEPPADQLLDPLTLSSRFVSSVISTFDQLMD